MNGYDAGIEVSPDTVGVLLRGNKFNRIANPVVNSNAIINPKGR